MDGQGPGSRYRQTAAAARERATRRLAEANERASQLAWQGRAAADRAAETVADAMSRRSRSSSPSDAEDLREARREFRRTVLASARRLLVDRGSICAGCGTELRHFYVDHVVPLECGGNNLEENLQLLCPQCRVIKGGALAGRGSGHVQAVGTKILRAVPGAVIDLLPGPGTAVKVIKFAGPYVVPLVINHMLTLGDRTQATVTEPDGLDYMLHVDMFPQGTAAEGRLEPSSEVRENGAEETHISATPEGAELQSGGHTLGRRERPPGNVRDRAH